MVYNIFKDGILVNSIIADEDFCEEYCKNNGYTYEMAESSERHIQHLQATVEERIAAVEAAIIDIIEKQL